MHIASTHTTVVHTELFALCEAPFSDHPCPDQINPVLLMTCSESTADAAADRLQSALYADSYNAARPSEPDKTVLVFRYSDILELIRVYWQVEYDCYTDLAIDVGYDLSRRVLNGVLSEDPSLYLSTLLELADVYMPGWR
jgi:hypothetical protein